MLGCLGHSWPSELACKIISISFYVVYIAYQFQVLSRCVSLQEACEITFDW